MGLQEAMRRLLAGGLLPERAGAAGRGAGAHAAGRPDPAGPQHPRSMQEWAAQVRAQSAAAAGRPVGQRQRRRNIELDGDAPRGVACNASLTPVVTGEVDPAALDEMVQLCVRLDKLRHGGRGGTSGGGGADGTGGR